MLGDAHDGVAPNARHTFTDSDVTAAITIKRYNGAAVLDGAPGSQTGTGDYCVWRNQTATSQGRWEFRRWRVRGGELDRVSYVDRVIAEF